MFQMLGVFAEFERGIIRERVNAGLARARQNGTKLGRRRVKPSVEAQTILASVTTVLENSSARAAEYFMLTNRKADLNLFCHSASRPPHALAFAMYRPVSRHGERVQLRFQSLDAGRE
jgi:hypothetical protein